MQPDFLHFQSFSSVKTTNKPEITHHLIDSSNRKNIDNNSKKKKILKFDLTNQNNITNNSNIDNKQTDIGDQDSAIVNSITTPPHSPPLNISPSTTVNTSKTGDSVRTIAGSSVTAAVAAAALSAVTPTAASPPLSSSSSVISSPFRMPKIEDDDLMNSSMATTTATMTEEPEEGEILQQQEEMKNNLVHNLYNLTTTEAVTEQAKQPKPHKQSQKSQIPENLRKYVDLNKSYRKTHQSLKESLKISYNRLRAVQSKYFNYYFIEKFDQLSEKYKLPASQKSDQAKKDEEEEKLALLHDVNYELAKQKEDALTTNNILDLTDDEEDEEEEQINPTTASTAFDSNLDIVPDTTRTSDLFWNMKRIKLGSEFERVQTKLKLLKQKNQTCNEYIEKYNRNLESNLEKEDNEAIEALTSSLKQSVATLDSSGSESSIRCQPFSIRKIDQKQNSPTTDTIKTTSDEDLIKFDQLKLLNAFYMTVLHFRQNTLKTSCSCDNFTYLNSTNLDIDKAKLSTGELKEKESKKPRTCIFCYLFKRYDHTINKLRKELKTSETKLSIDNNKPLVLNESNSLIRELERIVRADHSYCKDPHSVLNERANNSTTTTTIKKTSVSTKSTKAGQSRTKLKDDNLKLSDESDLEEGEIGETTHAMSKTVDSVENSKESNEDDDDKIENHLVIDDTIDTPSKTSIKDLDENDNQIIDAGIELKLDEIKNLPDFSYDELKFLSEGILEDETNMLIHIKNTNYTSQVWSESLPTSKRNSIDSTPSFCLTLDEQTDNALLKPSNDLKQSRPSCDSNSNFSRQSNQLQQQQSFRNKRLLSSSTQLSQSLQLNRTNFFYRDEKENEKESSLHRLFSIAKKFDYESILEEDDEEDEDDEDKSDQEEEEEDDDTIKAENKKSKKMRSYNKNTFKKIRFNKTPRLIHNGNNLNSNSILEKNLSKSFSLLNKSDRKRKYFENDSLSKSMDNNAFNRSRNLPVNNTLLNSNNKKFCRRNSAQTMMRSRSGSSSSLSNHDPANSKHYFSFSKYDIDNIIIPTEMLNANHKQIDTSFLLQKSDVPTPKWRESTDSVADLDNNSTNQTNSQSKSDMDEDLSDEAFIQRHELAELKERYHMACKQLQKRNNNNNNNNNNFSQYQIDTINLEAKVDLDQFRQMVEKIEHDLKHVNSPSSQISNGGGNGASNSSARKRLSSSSSSSNSKNNNIGGNNGMSLIEN